MEEMRNPYTNERMLYLMLSLPENLNAMNIAVVKNILKRGYTPLVVSINMPYRVLAKVYRHEGFDPEKVYVIDAVTLYSGGTSESGARVRFISTPSNLTNLRIAITEMIMQIREPDKCIMFDSISMLLIHTPSVTTSKLLHFVVNKLKLNDVSGLFLCVEKGLDPLVFSQMSTHVDKVVDFEKGEIHIPE